VNVSLYIAKRYLFAKSNKNAVNIISRIAIVAVVIGSMALFIVLSGFSGLREFSTQFTNIFDADLKIFPETGKTFIFTDSIEKKINSIEGINHVSKIIEERVFLNFKGKSHITFIKGVDKNYPSVIAVDSILYLKNWFSENENEVVIGLNTSAKLSLGVYDYSSLLELYVPKPGAGQLLELDLAKAFQKEAVIVSGIYRVNEALDGKYVFADINLTRRLLSIPENRVSSLEIKLKPNANEGAIRSNLKEILGGKVVIKNRIQQNDALYKMLNVENLFVYIFVSLIAAIAIFNITGTIIMVILEKKRTIKTLSSLGMTIQEIRKIFFLKGVFMTLVGVSIGLVLGVITILLQLQYGFVPITPSLPYPVKFEFLNLLIVFITICVLGGLASKIAATKASEKLISDQK